MPPVFDSFLPAQNKHRHRLKYFRTILITNFASNLRRDFGTTRLRLSWINMNGRRLKRFVDELVSMFLQLTEEENVSRPHIYATIFPVGLLGSRSRKRSNLSQ